MLGHAGWGEVGWGDIPDYAAITIASDFQWTQGTIDLIRGSATVIGVASGFTAVSPTDLLLVLIPSDPEISLIYEIAAVINDEELALTVPWQGPNVEGAPYLVHRRHGSLPRLQRQDEGIAPLMTYAFARIDRALAVAEVGPEPPPSGAWILATGIWNDTGIWDDAEAWNDG